jgi:hypothetical protein
MQQCGEDLLVTFPKATKDQFYQGQLSMLKMNDLFSCPLRLLKLYFKIFGQQFSDTERDSTCLHCIIFWQEWETASIGSEASHRAQLAQGNLQDLLVRLGCEGKSFIDKSIQMLGITIWTWAVLLGVQEIKTNHIPPPPCCSSPALDETRQRRPARYQYENH